MRAWPVRIWGCEMTAVRTATQLMAEPVPAWLDTWGDFAAGRPALPAEVAARARLALLDCIGAIAAGAAEAEVQALAARMTAGAFGVPGLAGGYAAADAALLGGTAGTMLELDEGNQYCRGHPAIHVVPALLSVAASGTTAEALLRALALGYEAGARVGIAGTLRVTMHPHGTWGAIGAAVGVASLHGADAAGFRAAFGLASSLGLSTSRMTMLEGATVRNVYAGVANRMGLLAWDLAQAGFTAERDGVGMVFGQIAGTAWNEAAMTEDLGTRWEVARNYFKRHAACRYTHGALDALEQLGPLDPAQVASIDVATYVWAAQLDHPEPRGMLAAKFSVPFALATRIIQGHSGVPAFRAPWLTDAATLALAARVTVREDASLTAMLPGLRPARLAVTMTDGRVLRAEALTNRGDTEDPYTPAEVAEKFMDLTGPVYGPVRAKSLRDLVLGLDGDMPIAPLLKALPL